MFKRLSLVTAILAFCVVILGAYVRLSDAGLGCPDWPGCYGALSVPQSETAIAAAQQNYPDKPLDHGKAWKEMAHRYLAGCLGVLILVSALIAFKQKKTLPSSVTLSMSLVVIVGLQAMLGMWTVTLLLKPAIVTLHLLGGMTTLAILVWIAIKNNTDRQIILSLAATGWLRLGVIIVILQILLGGWTSTNYAALACTDFPTCHGVWWPTMDMKDGFHVLRALGQSAYGGQLHLDALTAIQWVHRLGAIVVFCWGLVAALLLWKQATRHATLLLCVLSVQVMIGISNLILHLPTILAVMHNAGAALLISVLILINAQIQTKTYQVVKGKVVCSPV